MKKYKKEFIEFLLETEALKFGEFILKSGRKSPFFMNIGSFTSGSQIKKLSEYYAHAIYENYGRNFDVIFGPAYKGIPLAVAISIALYDLYGINVRYSANRKELKDHGDIGQFLGDNLSGKTRVVIIEDVTTSGKSIEETFPLITQNPDVEVLGLMVSVDRGERGKSEVLTALDEIKETYKIEAKSIVSMDEVIKYLNEDTHDGKYTLSEEMKNKIRDYYSEYGVK